MATILTVIDMPKAMINRTNLRHVIDYTIKIQVNCKQIPLFLFVIFLHPILPCHFHHPTLSKPNKIQINCALNCTTNVHINCITKCKLSHNIGEQNLSCTCRENV